MTSEILFSGGHREFVTNTTQISVQSAMAIVFSSNDLAEPSVMAAIHAPRVAERIERRRAFIVRSP
jgi:hypothetical protein